MGLISICFIVLFFFKIVLCAQLVNLSHDKKKNSWKYDYDNQERQLVGFLYNGVLQYYPPGKIKLFFRVWSTTGRSVLHLIEFFWEKKWNLTAKQLAKRLVCPCFWKKGKLYIELFWPSFTMMAKKNTLSGESLLPWRKTWKKVMW